MQTTLLGIAIVIILALVTALVGPLFVDWNQYRDQFEAEASRLTGLTVRVSGPIEARLLPTPTMILQKVDISRPGDASGVHADKLGIEFALGALVRGEWRASNVRVEGAEFALGLDPSGHLDWPAPAVGFDPDAISIQSLDIVDSRALLADGAHGTGIVLDDFEFQGELRSLLGPLKGEGAFVLNGQHYPFRLSVGRPGDDGAARVRLNLDPIDLPLTVDADGAVTVDAGVPHFEGTLQLARPVRRADKGDKNASALIVEPWRISSRVKADTQAAVFEQVEFQYGPDDRAIKLKGDARLSLGRTPRLDGALSSTQIDLDRLLALPESVKRRPFAAAKALADYFAGTQALPIPFALGVSVDQVTFAGAPLQRVSGDVKSTPENSSGTSWDIQSLEFRAPGAAQVRLSGRFGVADKGLTFAGPVKVEAFDPRKFVSWLTDRADLQATSSGPLRAEGNLRLASDRFAVDHLKAELDSMTLQGRLAYTWASGDRPPRIEAALSAPDLDVDRAQALVEGAFGHHAFEWPREGMLAIKVGHTSFGGIEAGGADVHMRFGANGLNIERFALGDLGGAALSVKGHIDSRNGTPRGSLSLDLDARALDGVATVMAKVEPSLAHRLLSKANSLVPAKLHATLAINASDGGDNAAAFRVDGRTGAFRIDLHGKATGGKEAFTAAHLGKLAAAKLDLSGHVDADDSDALSTLFGLDGLLAIGPRPGRLTFTASGAPDADMAVEAQFAAGGLTMTSKGRVRLSGNDGPTAALALKIAHAQVHTVRPVPAGVPAPTLPATFAAKLSLAEGALGLTDFNGKVGATAVSGRLRLALSEPAVIEGDLKLDQLDLPAAIAAAIGVPRPIPAVALASTATGDASIWPAEPFDEGLLGKLEGRLKVRVAHLALTPKLSAQDVRGVLNFDASAVSLEQIDGALGGGRMTGDLQFQRAADGLTMTSHVRLASANPADLLPGNGKGALAGHLTLVADVMGSGRSAGAVIGSLKGAGTFTLQDGRLAGLDPAAFDAITREVDLGLPIDSAHIKERVDLALEKKSLAVPLAEGEILIAAGRARIANVAVHTRSADLTVTAGADLAQGTINARFTMQGLPAKDHASKDRPELNLLLKGPVGAPERTLDVSALTTWLSLRRIEQQTKRIESLEAARKSAPPQAPAAEASPATQPPAKPPQPISKTQPSPKPPTHSSAEARRRASSGSPAATGQLPTLPPPIDIRPVPRGPRIESGAFR